MTLMKKYLATNNNYQFKYVPGLIKSGFLDPKAKNEIKNMAFIKYAKTYKPKTDIKEIRNGMGWPNSKYMSSKDLLISNNELSFGLKIRIYVQRKYNFLKMPTIFFIHGGGFYGGDLDNVEQPCKLLAGEAKIRIVSLAYSLAPERPFPNGILDCYRALVEIYSKSDELGVDLSNIYVMGDSAGGTITYNVLMLDKMFGTNYIKKAVVLYPVTYMGTSEKKLDELHRLDLLNIKKDSILLTKYFNHFYKDDIRMINWYLNDVNCNSVLASPLNASPELLGELPPVLLIIGEFDPLRLQGEELYSKIKLAGGNIKYIRYNGMIHAFMDKVGDFEQADDALKEALNFLLKKETE